MNFFLNNAKHLMKKRKQHRQTDEQTNIIYPLVEKYYNTPMKYYYAVRLLKIKTQTERKSRRISIIWMGMSNN